MKGRERRFKREMRKAARLAPEISREDLLALAAVEYDAVAGSVILASRVECHHPEFGTISVVCNPPAIARVEPLAEGSASDLVSRWMDWESLDPIYEISILAPHPALEEVNARPSWVYGTCRWLSGDVYPASFALADDEMQHLYKDVQPISYGADFDQPEPPSASAPIR